VNPTDTVLTEMRFEIPMQQGSRLGIQRNDWMILNMIAANGWKRPIYFTSPYGSMGFGDYLRKDGLTYRLVPVKTKNPDNWIVRTYMRENNLDIIEKNLMNKFVYTSKRGVYFDEENRRHALNLRTTYAEAAGDMADAGKKDKALNLLHKCESMIPKEDLPYAMIGRDNGHNVNGLIYLEACYKAGEMQLAEKIRLALKKDLEQQQKYYQYIKTEREDLFAGFDGQDGEAAKNDYCLFLLKMLEDKYHPAAKPNVNETQKGPIINNPDTSKQKDSNKKR
jgi:hypothetical protein